MIKLKPIALAVMGCGLIQGCGAPPPARPLAVQPVVRGDMPGNQAASWNRLGRFHHERGQLALALGAYAQSLALDANQLEARNAVAVIEAQQGDLEAARKALVALVNDFPGEAQPHTNLGYVLHLMGDHAGAAQTLHRAMALGAGPKAFQNLQLAEAALGKAPGGAEPRLAAAPAPAPATAPATAAAAAVAASVPDPSAQAPSVVPLPAPAPRREPQLLTVLPSSSPEVASHMELVKVAGNVYELKARVAADPVAAPAATATLAATAAPAVAAVAPKPAVQAVAQADKVRMARLEVANGNGVTGMARRFRNVLGQMGIPVERLSNDKPYKQVSTTIQYSPGFEKQAAGLQKALQGKAQLSSKQLASSDVRLVLGKDAQLSLAAATEAAGLSLVAMQDGK
ncbi:LytR C-terminal domain-containing protein [Pseudoduganella violaceinigra]|uniref:LytR C-terminal domain-containing protein n=1 Tax=Pseudoduganella violaceinigra TaxID=246602 RepID=UPI00041E317D|nr:LytR C-terminal domain-containing protein [Pseudoduganella violaceinigra]